MQSQHLSVPAPEHDMLIPIGKYMLDYSLFTQIFRTSKDEEKKITFQEIDKGMLVMQHKMNSFLYIQEAPGKIVEVFQKRNLIFRDKITLQFIRYDELILKTRDGKEERFYHSAPPIAPMAPPPSRPAKRQKQGSAQRMHLRELTTEEKKEVKLRGKEIGNHVKNLLQIAATFNPEEDFLKIYEVVQLAAYVGGKLDKPSDPLTKKIVTEIKLFGYDFAKAIAKTDAYRKEEALRLELIHAKRLESLATQCYLDLQKIQIENLKLQTLQLQNQLTVAGTPSALFYHPPQVPPILHPTRPMVTIPKKG